MSKQNVDAWQNAVDRVLSGCIDYKATPAKVHGIKESDLKAAVVDYLCRKGKTQEEADRLYGNALSDAMEKKRPDSQASAGAGVASVIGWIAVIVNAINFFVAGLNPFFAVFLLLSLSLAKSGDVQLKKARLAKEAMAIWNKAAQSGNAQNLSSALEDMEKIFAKAKK